VEDVSSERAEWLEVIVVKNVAEGVFDTLLRIKATNLGARMLEPSSMHAPWVHRTWPLGFIQRRMDLCNKKVHRDAEGHRIINSFTHDGFPDGIIELLRSSLNDRRYKLKRASAPPNRRCFWFVMPYHKSMHVVGMDRALQHFMRMHGNLLERVFQVPVRVGFAWSNAFPNIQARIERCWKSS